MRARASRWIDALTALAALGLTGWILRAWGMRLGYPFDLEWMEGGMLAHTWRIRQGLPLYPPPGPDWVPYIYPPGYPALLAALSPLTGLDYGPGRLISIFGTLGAAGALAATVAYRGSWLVGVCSAAVFLGCWRASGAFYDLVRPDGLAMGLVAGSLLALRMGRDGGPQAPIASGLLLALAFPIKHHVAAFGFPFVFGWWISAGRPAAVRFALASAVPAGLFALAMSAATDGRFLQYLLAVPAHHPWIWPRLYPGVFGELPLALGPAIALGGAWLLWRCPRRRPGWWLSGAVAGVIAAYLAPEPQGVEMPPRFVVALTMGLVAAVGVAVIGALPTSRRPLALEARRWWTAVAVLGTFFGVALAMRAHNGGFLNVLMPLHYGIALGMGLVATDLRRFANGTSLTGLVFLLQLGWLGSRLDVDEVIPTDADVRAGQEVLERLSRCADGPIFAPYAAWLPQQVGRDPSTHLIALWDLKESPYDPALADVVAAVHARRWTCVLTGGRQRLGYGVEEAYRPETTFRYDGKELTTKTGWRVRPYQVWVPLPGSSFGEREMQRSVP